VLPDSIAVALGRPAPRLTAPAMLADVLASTALAGLSATVLARPIIDGTLAEEH
jgi:hypothetical protein